MVKPKKEVICINNLTTGYRTNGKNEIIVTKDLAATLYSGEMTCLLGPNGAGKSTLLRTLIGFQPALSGEISIEGKDITEYQSEELSRLIGVVLTDRPEMGQMTVREVIAMGRAPYTGYWGNLTNADEMCVDRAITLSGLESLASRNVMTLSDGERQKVMIAKALAQETPVIFLDEPTAYLDYPGKCATLRLLRRLAHEEGKAVFLSTHDLELALQIADKLWLLDKMLGVRIGTTKELASNGSIEAYFHSDGMKFDSNTFQFRII